MSYFYQDGTPSLALNGPTSLRVTYGAPLYDGGDRITVFQVRSVCVPLSALRVLPCEKRKRA